MHKLLGSMTLAAALLIGAPVLSAQAQGDDDAASKLFAQLDANQDGKLTQAEFTAHPDLTADVFKAWDANGDGSVSKAEFVKNYK